MVFLKDMLAAVENPLLKNTIKEYMTSIPQHYSLRSTFIY